MSLTFLQIKKFSRGDLLLQIPPEKIKYLDNDKLVHTCNEVANDLNTRAEIHSEYFSQNTTENETNYILRGPIERIYKIKYYNSQYSTTEWARVTKDANGYGRFVFKENPPGGNKLEIWYLRGVLNIDGNDTDIIDLPDSALFNYLDLVKLKILIDLGVIPQSEYDAKFNYAVKNINARLDRKGFQPKRPKDFWLGLIGGFSDYPRDENIYEITRNEKGEENVMADSSGHYYWVT